MIAQLSHSDPLGNPSSSSSGVRSAGSFARNSGVPFFPHMSTSSKSSPAARTKMRVLRLFTLGVRMLSLFAAICSSSSKDSLRRSIFGQAGTRALDQQLDCVGEVRLLDVVVAALDPQPVR